jgi:hypothetical protein
MKERLLDALIVRKERGFVSGGCLKPTANAESAHDI